MLLAFVAEYGGQDVLAAPIDRGFNRLAWIVPYAVGLRDSCAADCSPCAGRAAPAQQVAVAGGPNSDDALECQVE